MSREIELRVEAMRRLLKGETKSSISRALGKSRKWVSYWSARYDPSNPIRSLQNRSSAPQNPQQAWPDAIKQMVLNSRHLRMAAQAPTYEYALIGAEAIHFELKALGLSRVPPVRTIHYWIEQAGLVSAPQTREIKEKTNTAYPAPVCEAINAVHQLDLKGPLYLKDNANKYYLLALRDYHSKAVALDASENRQAQTIADFLVAAWQRLGLPNTLQMDNGLEFRGSNRYPRSFGKVVRLCLDVGVEPLFIPPREPWRNGLIENLNGQAQRLLLNHDHFTDYAQLQLGVRKLETAINTSHRLAALDGQTPQEFRAEQLIQMLPHTYNKHQQDLTLDKGSIAFIRLVRKSGRITLHAGDKFDIDPDLAWQYVLARVNVADKKLRVYHNEQLIKSFDY
jgi:transposase InsO family protein